MNKDTYNFQDFYRQIKTLARARGECAGGACDWANAFESGQTALQAFYDEFPEHSDVSEYIAENVA